MINTNVYNYLVAQFTETFLFTPAFENMAALTQAQKNAIKQHMSNVIYMCDALHDHFYKNTETTDVPVPSGGIFVTADIPHGHVSKKELDDKIDGLIARIEKYLQESHSKFFRLTILPSEGPESITTMQISVYTQSDGSLLD